MRSNASRCAAGLMAVSFATAGDSTRVEVSVDAVAYRGSDECVDIISGAGDETPTRPTWGVTERRESNVWVQPPPFPDTPEKPKEPETPVNSEWKAVTDELKSLILDLTQRGQKAEESADAAQSAAIETLERVNALSERVDRLHIVSDALGKEVSTGNTWSHAHKMKLRIEG